ncbi:hypothetical protein DAL43_23960 [Salmonella enterica subsp. enterica serovar Enteritidis]|nr:hypothetical protein [Salmonella enterica subsp. enterica serovar Enteritidis]
MYNNGEVATKKLAPVEIPAPTSSLASDMPIVGFATDQYASLIFLNRVINLEHNTLLPEQVQQDVYGRLKM